jgi:hypothetical protein
MFLKYLRCPRSAYFESGTSKLVYEYKDTLANLSSEEEKALLRAEFDEKIKGHVYKLQEMSNEGEDDNDEDEDDIDFSYLLKDDKLLAVMNDTFFKIETLSSKKVQSLFGGNVQSGQRDGSQVYGQKILNLFEEGYNFYTFSDVYQEDEQAIRLIETKSTTSLKFIKLGYTENKQFYPLFTETPDGNLILTEEIDPSAVTDKYNKARSKLFDRLDVCGRYVYDLAWQRYLIENNPNKSQKPIHYFLAVLNTKYYFDGKKDENGHNVYDANALITLIDLTQITLEMMPQMKKDFELVRSRFNAPDGKIVNIEKTKCLYGKGHHQCPWFAVCKKDHHVPEHNSIFAYLGGHRGFGLPKSKDKYSIDDLIAIGDTSVFDIDYEWLEPNQKIQYRVFESGKPYVDQPFISKFIADIKYPIYHLDFETMNYPIPMFKGEKPYQQSVFQYSIHVEPRPNATNDEIIHYEFLARGLEDEREELIKKMIEAIPNNGQGTVIAYNQGFEKSVITKLAEMFPQYSLDLFAIRNRINDLMYIVKPSKEVREALDEIREDGSSIAFYEEGLQRSFSIKKVLPVFVPSLNYALLEEVHNGTDAQMAYMKQTLLSGEELERTRKNMLKYCEQDTWAMVEILRSVKTMLKK